MNYRSNSYSNTFTDLLFNILVGILFLFILALLLINPISRDASVKKKAEWIIEMTWPNENDCDIDLWVRDPNNNTVSFKKKSVGLMHIERDDLGKTSDIFYDSYGNLYRTEENREIWTLRGKMNGVYIVNVHSYSCKEENQVVDITGMPQYKKVGDPIEVPVTLKIIRINPYYMEFKTVVVTIKEVWEEVTAMVIELKDNTAEYKGNNFVRIVDAVK